MASLPDTNTLLLDAIKRAVDEYAEHGGDGGGALKEAMATLAEVSGRVCRVSSRILYACGRCGATTRVLEKIGRPNGAPIWVCEYCIGRLEAIGKWGVNHGR